jgi:hypothetical protein
MNAPHWHLAMNHLPVVGMFFGTLLLGFGLWRKSEEVIRVSLGFLVLVALTGVPVYFTGEPAETVLMDVTGVDESLVGAHEKAATIAFIGAAVVGAVTLGILIVFRKAPALPGWVKFVALTLSVIATALLGWTANLGGKIQHPEVRSGPAQQQEP